MLSLVFRHLISCNFLVPSFRSKLNYADPHGRAAYKFLSLVPVSCDPPATPLTPRRTPFFQSPSSGPTSLPNSSHVQVSRSFQSFLEVTKYNCMVVNIFLKHVQFQSQAYAVYLADAQNVIRQTHLDCSLWTNSYDGLTVSNNNQNQSVHRSPTNQIKVTPKISIELGQDPLEDNIEFGGRISLVIGWYY